MKKIILTILSALCMLLGVCFVACDEETAETYVYYGVIQTIEGQEGLYVQIPNIGLCEMPTYENDKVPNIAFREGYLVTFEFSSQIQVTKSNPAIIATPARSASVYKDKVEFEITENSYLLTIKITQQMMEEILACDSKVSDTVWFQGVLENQVLMLGGSSVFCSLRGCLNPPFWKTFLLRASEEIFFFEHFGEENMLFSCLSCSSTLPL